MTTTPGADEPGHGAAAVPSRRQAVVFSGKAWGLRAVRWGRDLARGRPRRFSRETTPAEAPILAESRGRLFPSELAAEFVLQAGKVQNLRLAVATLHGLRVPAGEVFSFWAHVSRPTRRRGYVAGRELREGCVIPSVGGGLCQLSNALYDAALRAGFEIVERHAHSRRLPGSMAEVGRDATVFWNYVDLRFRPPAGCRIEAFLTREELVVRLRALTTAPDPNAPARPTLSTALVDDRATVESCETCGVVTCFRHPAQTRAGRKGVTAFLVDAWWPEFDRFLLETVNDGDELLLPLDGVRFRLKSYRWDIAGFQRVRQAPGETLRRAWASRRLASQGAARQRALLRFDAALAARYARMISPGATHLVVSQNLLPHLWASGVLGGRTFDVLMTRLPISAFQAALDRASARHPDSPTLADFRADSTLTRAEEAALAETNRWITPHRGVARLAGVRAHLLSWHLPERQGVATSPSGLKDTQGSAGTVYFPASTLGRKGAYELREAARRIGGLRVQLGGPVLEGANFWRGVETLPVVDSEDWLRAAAVVLPSWVEHQPRRLLAAVAAGRPVVTSQACGLDGVPGVTTVPDGDVPALVKALQGLTAVPAPSVGAAR